jgi:hypothetical protein
LIEYLYGINPIEAAFAVKRRKFEKLILAESETINTGYKATKIIQTAK